MEIIKGFNNIKHKFKHPVVAIGTFDGVHLGHQEIIRCVVKEARRLKGTSIVITFDKKPLTVLSSDKSPDLLMILADKIARIKKMGVKTVIVVNFDKKVAEIPADNFIKNILYKKLRVEKIIVSNQFRFGQGRKGNVEVLKAMAPKYGYTVKIIKEKRYNNIIISSTKIRQLIRSGLLPLATRFLGHPHTISGYVAKGSEWGKVLGFPTANVQYEKAVVVPQGVYTVEVEVARHHYKGICNMGIRPTFQVYDQCLAREVSPSPKDKNIMEVHIFDFNRNIYNQDIKITFIKKIRNERFFNNLNDLIHRIDKDIIIAKRILSSKISLQSD